jgi:hypothetical protein
MMFRHGSVATVEVSEIEQGTYPGTCADPVPLSVLGLDLPVPAEGWNVWLAGQGISVVFDDIGRRCVSREDARALLEQQRQSEIRRQDQLVRLEEQAVAADELRRARMFRGIRVDEIPVGMSPAEYMMAGDPDLAPRRKSAAASFLDGDEMVLHPIHEPAEEAS